MSGTGTGGGDCNGGQKGSQKGAKDHGSGLSRQRREDIGVKMEGISLEEPRSKKWVLARLTAQHQRSWWPVPPQPPKQGWHVCPQLTANVAPGWILLESLSTSCSPMALKREKKAGQG